jgi:hypothetical protein
VALRFAESFGGQNGRHNETVPQDGAIRRQKVRQRPEAGMSALETTYLSLALYFIFVKNLAPKMCMAWSFCHE